MSEVQDACKRGRSVPCRWSYAPTMWTSPWGHTSTPLPLTPTSWRQPSSRAKPWACHLSRPSVSALLLLFSDCNTVLDCIHKAGHDNGSAVQESVVRLDYSRIAVEQLLASALSTSSCSTDVTQYDSCKLSLIHVNSVTLVRNLPALYIRSRGQLVKTSFLFVALASAAPCTHV